MCILYLLCVYKSYSVRVSQLLLYFFIYYIDFPIFRITQDKITMPQPPHMHRNHPLITLHPKTVFLHNLSVSITNSSKGTPSRCITASLSYLSSTRKKSIIYITITLTTNATFAAPALYHLNWSGINLQVGKPQENVKFKFKQIRRNKPPTSGQRFLCLSYEKIPLFLLSISGIPKIVKNENKTYQNKIKLIKTKMAHVNIKHGKISKKNYQLKKLLYAYSGVGWAMWIRSVTCIVPSLAIAGHAVCTTHNECFTTCDQICKSIFTQFAI